MIKLFNLENYVINTADYTNLLHDGVVKEFEDRFAEYVGAKYACGVNSATNAIFLAFLNKSSTVEVPSIIPPVVCNALLTSGNQIKFVDNVDWVGREYWLGGVLDSAQNVERDIYRKNCVNELAVFSFYPTKPVGSIDGGMLVSNDKDLIDYFRVLSMNGMEFATNNWYRKNIMPGYKFYLNSVQADIANRNLSKLDEKLEKLSEIREVYNRALGYNNISNHLYRIKVLDNQAYLREMHNHGIHCGIHYNALHLDPVYQTGDVCVKSAELSKQTVSIPFHEKLSKQEVRYVIDVVKKLSYIL